MHVLKNEIISNSDRRLKVVSGSWVRIVSHLSSSVNPAARLDGLALCATGERNAKRERFRWRVSEGRRRKRIYNVIRTEIRSARIR